MWDCDTALTVKEFDNSPVGHARQLMVYALAVFRQLLVAGSKNYTITVWSIETVWPILFVQSVANIPSHRRLCVDS